MFYIFGKGISSEIIIIIIIIIYIYNIYRAHHLFKITLNA